MKELMASFIRLIGNKRYMSDLERILVRLEVTPQERHTLQLLTQDLNYIKQELSDAERKSRQPWRKW